MSKLTDDFANGLGAISIGEHSLGSFLSKKSSPSIWGLLQQYRHMADQSPCGGMSVAGEADDALTTAPPIPYLLRPCCHVRVPCRRASSRRAFPPRLRTPFRRSVAARDQARRPPRHGARPPHWRARCALQLAGTLWRCLGHCKAHHGERQCEQGCRLSCADGVTDAT